MYKDENTVESAFALLTKNIFVSDSSMLGQKNDLPEHRDFQQTLLISEGKFLCVASFDFWFRVKKQIQTLL